MSGYRDGARVCELCRRELQPGAELADEAGLAACSECRRDIPRAAATAWSLQLRGAEESHLKESRYDQSYVKSVVQIGLPTAIPMSGSFRAEHAIDRAGRALGSDGDQTLGDEAFDGKVWIHHIGGGVTRKLLADPVVRLALMDAVAAAGTVTLDREGITLQTRKSGFSLEQLDAVDRAGIVLGVAIERWVRSAPGCAPLQPGCSDRPQPAMADPGAVRPEPAAPAPLDPVYHVREKPGPPCPACGEPTTNAVTEYICKACGEVVDRPEVRKRIGRRDLKTALIGAAILLVVAGLIVLGVVLDSSKG